MYWISTVKISIDTPLHPQSTWLIGLLKTMQGTLFKLLAVARRVDLQKTYCCLKQSTYVLIEL